MSDKYIDLADRVMAATATTPNTTRASAIGDTLEFLDRNPDQVPGRTITRSEFDSAVDAVEESQYATTVARFLEFAQALGFTVVPDPEPTNAEKLADDLLDCRVAFSEWEVVAVAGHLTERGWTKAPGGDDDR